MPSDKPQIRTYVNKEIVEAARIAAARQDRTVSSWLYKIVKAQLKRQRLWPEKEGEN